MARQKCVLSAMLAQLSPATVLTRFQAIADASKQVVTTDVPASELDTVVQLARMAKRLPVASVSFVPPRIQTYDPDLDVVHQMVDAAIDRAERADDASPPTVLKRPGRSRPATKHERANKTDNLALSCG